MTDTANPYQEINLDHLDPSPTNPRKHYGKEAMAGLVKSIRDDGVLLPLLVRFHPTAKGHFEIIAGERRFKAATKAGLERVPCRIINASDERALEIQAAENLAREDLNPLEEAATYEALMKATGKTQEQLAEKYKRTQSYIANRLRLLKLPKRWKSKLIDGTAPVTFGRDLAGWLKYPAVYAELDRAVERIKKNMPTGGVMELPDYRLALADAIHEVSEPFYKLSALGTGAALQKEVDVVTIPDHLGGGQRIMNTERLAELLQEHEWSQDDEQDAQEPPEATETEPELFDGETDETPAERPPVATAEEIQANVDHAQEVADRNKANQEAAAGPAVDYGEYWRQWVRGEIEARLCDDGDQFLAQVSRIPQFWNSWKPDEPFLKLHTFDQLKALAREWGLDMVHLEGYTEATQAMIDEILLQTTQKRIQFEGDPFHRIGPPLALIEQGWELLVEGAQG